MNDVTPGKKLILELLAKSIAKIEAAEAESRDAKTFLKAEMKETRKSEVDIVLKEEITEERENDSRDEKEGKLIDGEKKRDFKQENAVGFQIYLRPDHSQQESMSNLPVETEEIDHETDLKTKHKKKTKHEREESRKKKKLEENRKKKKLEREEKRKKKQIEREEKRKKKKLGREENREKKILKREENREKKKLKREENRVKKKLKREENSKFVKRLAGKGLKRFTLEEDAILFHAMEQFGDKINVQQISKDLQRNPQSIIDRVSRLKRNGQSCNVRYHCFTLTEDLSVLDAALKYLDKQSLKDLSLASRDWVEVGEKIGRDRLSPRKRWEYTLKPWILQHYSGTLNLEIRRPLANYLVEHFEDINSIDWPSVISKTEFAGLTLPSLRKKFTNLIITLKMIAEFANTKYVLGGRQVSG